MDKIIYQGREIAAKLVNSISGDFNVAPERLHSGEDQLWRDPQGQFYLRRSFRFVDYDSPQERAGSRRWLAHRISLRAAILWATVRTSANTWDLYNDTARLLREHHELATPYEAGEGGVTVPLTLPTDLYRQVLAMGAYDEREGFSATVEHCLSTDVKTWQEAGDKDPTLAEFLAEYEAKFDAGQHPDMWPPRHDGEAPAKKPTRLEAAGAIKALHPVTIHLNDKHLRMVRQSAKHDDHPTVEAFLLHEIKWAVIETMVQCYDHQRDRVEFGWSNDQADQPGRRLEVEADAPVKSIPTRGPLLSLLSLATLHADLLEAFCRHWGVSAQTFVVASVQDRLEHTFQSNEAEY